MMPPRSRRSRAEFLSDHWADLTGLALALLAVGALLTGVRP